MIRQPDDMTSETFETIMGIVKKKKPSIYLKETSFESIEDGKCVQILHKGSYDSEPLSFVKMNSFLETNQLKRSNPYHHREIYLTNARKSSPDKRQTILRYHIK